VICPNCQARLNAKDELIGQTRNCPGCGEPVVIRPAAERSPPAEPGDVLPSTVAPPAVAPEAPAVHVDAPIRLVRLNSYLVCDSSRVIATWENNGQGWRVKIDHGFGSAARNPERIPSQGDFKFVELRMAQTGDELRLKGIRVYQLVTRWALSGLARGDDLVCKSITGPGALVRVQKNAVRMHLQERFMRDVWGDAAAVLDYLGNGDFHSPGAGE
jgi:hypothetical protein